MLASPHPASAKLLAAHSEELTLQSLAHKSYDFIVTRPKFLGSTIIGGALVYWFMVEFILPYLIKVTRLLLLLIALLIVATQTFLPTTVNARPNKIAWSSSRIGAVESYYRPDDANEANVGWERIIFEWRFFQPNGPDDWDESSINPAWLDSAYGSGRMVVGLIKNAPHWATGSDLLGAPAQGLDLPIDDPNNKWATFVRKLVQRYSTRFNIHHWIIYNEPDIRPSDTNYFEYAGNVKDYYKTVKVAYKVAHATDPQAVIHLAGFTFWQDVAHDRIYYLERFLSTARTDPEAYPNKLFFDVLTVHVFDNTEWVWGIIAISKQLAETYGFPKPIWINEMNALISHDEGYPVAKRNYPKTTLDQQADFIIQGTALGLAAGVERIAIYRLFDNAPHPDYQAWGVVRGDGTRRPAYYALKTASKYFGNVQSAHRFRNDYATVVTMEDRGRTIYVAWNRTATPQSVQIRAVRGQSAVLVTPTGETTVLPHSEALDDIYELYLPPCQVPCNIQGKPQILIQPGSPQSLQLIRKGHIYKFKLSDE